MKATINGITVEGTPDEILAFYRQLSEQPQKQPVASTDALLKEYYKSTVKQDSKCPNYGGPCYCTGACMGHGQSIKWSTDTMQGNIQGQEQNMDSKAWKEAQDRHHQNYQAMWMQNDAQSIMGMGEVIGDTDKK